MTDYDGTFAQHTITGLDAGVYYKFAIIAINGDADSNMSDYVTIATTELPDQP